MRTKKGEIGYIFQINNENKYNKYRTKIDTKSSYKSTYLRKEDIVKHSKNIIDLIEVGDYVNGKLIHHTDIRKNSAYVYYGNGRTFTDYQIKSIVTKEQFDRIKYEV